MGRTYSKAGIKTYRLMAVLLYGKFKWIDRKQELLIVPMTKITSHMKITSPDLQQFLYQLENMGMVYDVRWSKNWFGCRLTTPESMAVIVPEKPSEPLEVDLDFDSMDYHKETRGRPRKTQRACTISIGQPTSDNGDTIDVK